MEILHANAQSFSLKIFERGLIKSLQNFDGAYLNLIGSSNLLISDTFALNFQPTVPKFAVIQQSKYKVANSSMKYFYKNYLSREYVFYE